MSQETPIFAAQVLFAIGFITFILNVFIIAGSPVISLIASGMMIISFIFNTSYLFWDIKKRQSKKKDK
ncbi:MAG: hypothetical protein ACLFR1_00725 [Spirochaetia bacterium]